MIMVISAVSAAIPSKFILDRNAALPKLIGRHEDFLVVAGLGSAQEISALMEGHNNFYVLGGAMGAASMMGLGLALARPDKHILVVTGDGELLMSLGSLAVIAVKNPPNLSIVCVDNGHYGETGYQKTHTSQGTNLEAIASGSGISRTMTVEEDAQIGTASRLIRETNGAAFVLLRVAPTDSIRYRVDLDGPATRYQFRKALSLKR
jgi:thiamine pyrophosphate-dependent acetolactate synthase large subunit-like protein